MSNAVLESVERLAANTHRLTEEYDKESSELVCMLSACNYSPKTIDEKKAIVEKRQKVDGLHDSVIEQTLRLDAAKRVIKIFDALDDL